MSTGAYPELYCGRKLGREMTTHAGIVGYYDYPLVALSVFIAILAAYAALDLAGRITSARGSIRIAWLWGGADALGSGIWAMHYLGMRTLHLPVPVLYDWPTVLLSLLVAILASGVALFIVTRPTMSLFDRVVGGIVMGSGIAATHFIGMASMRLPAMCVYDAGRIIFSITLVVALSYIALRLSFALKGEQTPLGWRKIGGTLVMGTAIPVMHYVGMAAVTFVPAAAVHGSVRHAVSIPGFISASITVITFALLGIVIASAAQDRQFFSQSQLVAENLAQLRAVFDSMTDAIVVVDSERNVVQHNNASARLLGWINKTPSLQEIVNTFDGFRPTGEPLLRYEWPVMRALHGDYCTNEEVVIRRKDTGKSITTEITTVRVAVSGETTRKFIVSLRDVTERNDAQRALKESEVLYRSLFETMEEGFCVLEVICDPAGQTSDYRYLEVNPAFYKLTGMQDMVGKRMREVYPEEDEFWFKLYEGIALTGEPAHIAHESKIAKGFYQIQAYRISDPKLRRVAVVFSEISQRRLLDETQTRLAAIVESSEDAIIGENYEGIITTWNRGAEKIYGYTATEMVGQPITSMLPPDRAGEEDTILGTIREGKVIEHFQTVHVRKDGHYINVWLTISPIRDANGNVIGASKIARDITEKMKLESQLLQSQKMDAIGQLTGGIAHDFNNLLCIVIGNLDLLKLQLGGDAAGLKRVHTAQKAALRGADLTRRLLAFSSEETLTPASTNLHHLIRNVLEMTHRVIGPEIRTITRFHESLSQVLIDAAGLESALLNLLVNARDAMPNGGCVTVTTRVANLGPTYRLVRAGELKAGRYAFISVSDTGTGMSKHVLEHVFEPFFTTKPRGKGTGLGLAMVYGFVKQSHGTVRIYSEPGYGTTVTLYLPLTEDASLPEAEAIESHIVLSGQATVLVVDDELDLLNIATAYLNDMGCKTFTAIDGNDALQIVEREKDIDLMITDIIMPGGMNGVDLAQQVRQLNPKIKVIYCSGFPAGALAERNMPPVDGPLLRKPYQREEFSALVHRMMESDDAEAPRALS